MAVAPRSPGNGYRYPGRRPLAPCFRVKAMLHARGSTHGLYMLVPVLMAYTCSCQHSWPIHARASTLGLCMPRHAVSDWVSLVEGTFLPSGGTPRHPTPYMNCRCTQAVQEKLYTCKCGCSRNCNGSPSCCHDHHDLPTTRNHNTSTTTQNVTLTLPLEQFMPCGATTQNVTLTLPLYWHQLVVPLI